MMHTQQKIQSGGNKLKFVHHDFSLEKMGFACMLCLLVHQRVIVSYSALYVALMTEHRKDCPKLQSFVFHSGKTHYNCDYCYIVFLHVWLLLFSNLS